MVTERLYDCILGYHLTNGQLISETFYQDLPSEVWATVRQEFLDFNTSMELQPSDTFAKILVPKSNILYITLKLSDKS